MFRVGSVSSRAEFAVEDPGALGAAAEGRVRAATEGTDVDPGGAVSSVARLGVEIVDDADLLWNASLCPQSATLAFAEKGALRIAEMGRAIGVSPNGMGISAEQAGGAPA